MAGIPDNPGNPNADQNGGGSGVYEKEACPLCGTDVKLLPHHLPECPER